MDFTITFKFSGEELFLGKIDLKEKIVNYIYDYKEFYIERIQNELSLNPAQISHIYKHILNKDFQSYLEVHYKDIQTCDSSFFNYKCALEIPVSINIEKMLKSIDRYGINNLDRTIS